MKHFLTLNSVLQGKSLPFFSTGNSSLQCWASPYFFNVPIYIGIHKWTLGYNSFLQFWNPISAWNNFFLWGESKTCWLCHSRKFSLSEVESAFSLKSVWHWLVAVAWEDSILVQESTGSPFWPTSQPEEKLPRNCSWRIARQLQSEKSFCEEEGEWPWWWKRSFWTCTRIWESK